MIKYSNSIVNQFAIDTSGNSGAGLTVTVRLTGTGQKASIFSDNGITPLPNPFPSDAQGNYGFFVDDGTYDITINESQPSQETISNVTIISPLEPISGITSPVELIAHRGFADNSFENTILALSLAPEQGADALEMDVSISSDGVFYLFHDTTVDNLTDGTGTFTSLTSSYIDGLKYTKADGTPYEGLKITKFDDALDFIRETGFKSYIEMKSLRNEDTDIDAFIQKLKDYTVLDQTIIQSFSVTALQRAKFTEPSSFLAYVVNSTDTATIIDNAILASASMVINSFGSFTSVPDMASDFANAGLDSASYTPDYAYTFKDLTDVGVRKIMSDRSAF